MKKLLLFAGLITTLTLAAQAPKPSFTKAGDFVKATFFHENGAVAQTGFYLEGKLHGEWKMFAENGDKIALGAYNLGNKTGKWFFWNDKALKEVDFINNKMAAVKQWSNTETIVLNK